MAVLAVLVGAGAGEVLHGGGDAVAQAAAPAAALEALDLGLDVLGGVVGVLAEEVLDASPARLGGDVGHGAELPAEAHGHELRRGWCCRRRR